MTTGFDYKDHPEFYEWWEKEIVADNDPTEFPNLHIIKEIARRSFARGYVLGAKGRVVLQ